MPDLIVRWLPALFAAALVVAAARAHRSLSIDGAIVAIVMGSVIVGIAGWWAGLLLVAFFVSSSVLSHTGRNRATTMQVRGPERDAVQVLANGGIALATVLLFGLTGAEGWLVALAGSLAAANADTWSTEIGRTSTTQPRMITTGRTVPAGTSGAVSRRGLLGALGGGALIGLLTAIGWRWNLLPGTATWLSTFAAVTAGGFAGSLLDSLLGSTIQDQRWCETCMKETEQRVHRCGTPTRSIRGVSWIDNDVVNVSCAVSGAIVAWIVMSLPG